METDATHPTRDTTSVLERGGRVRIGQRTVGSATIVGLLVALLGAVTMVAITLDRADAATITASYEVGHRNVVINDYGTNGLGVFRLRADDGDPDAGTSWFALCLEADVAHVTTPGTYRLVPNRVDAPELDYLLWRYGVAGHPGHVPLGADHDTATALGALAWFHADAHRRSGGAVWADHARGYAPITPTTPNPWDALPRFSSTFPVGLRSDGRELDAAERRVAQLHRESRARRGPWQLVGPHETDGHLEVLVRGPGGPIDGVPVEFTVSRPGEATPSVVTVVTGSDGSARIDRPADGQVRVLVAAPGIHREWDGDGAVQRMATGTSVELTAELGLTSPTTTTTTTTIPVTTTTLTTTIPTTIPATTTTVAPTTTPTTAPATTTTVPALAHLVVVKRSSDALFSPDGAVIELRDGLDQVVEIRTTGHDGIARFAPLPPAVHPPPYTLIERDAPVGLAPVGAPLVLTGPLSVRADSPTTVELVNHPRVAELVVVKELSDPDVGPGDRAGFTFSVERADDERDLGTATTGPDGRSTPVPITAGTFRICETDGPPWATSLLDTACIDVVVASDQLGSTIEVPYVNTVPAPTIVTRVRLGGVDDEATSAPPSAPVEVPTTGGILIDRVTLDGLVPGTPYELLGRLVLIDAGEAHDLGAPTSHGFIASGTEHVVDMHVEVPPSPDPDRRHEGVVFQELRIGERLVAIHDDPEDLAQRFAILGRPAVTTTALPTTTSTATTSPPDTASPTTTAPDTTTPDTTTVATAATTTTVTTTPDTTTPSTTTPDTTTPDTTTTVVQVLPPPRVVEAPTARPSLPRTGGAVVNVLRVASLLLALGVAALAITRGPWIAGFRRTGRARRPRR